MERPTLKHPATIQGITGRFVVLAYRKLSRQEVRECLSAYLHGGGRRPKKNEIMLIERDAEPAS
jgi:hypothetical protein